MKHIGFTALILLVVNIFTLNLPGQGLRISVLIPDWQNREVILSHRWGLKFYSDDTVKTNSAGVAIFEGLDPLPEGMYQLVFPDKKYAEFFLGRNQIFNILTRSASPSDHLSFSGSPENSRFLEWQRAVATNRGRTTSIQNRLKKENLAQDSILLLNKELQQIQVFNNRLWDSAIQDLAGTLPGNFIKGLRPLKIPDSLGKSDTPDDQKHQYQFVRAHFFDEIDFSDERLLRTPLIETKLDQYFRQVVPPMPDTIIRDARKVIERSKPSKKMFQFVVQYLFNRYSDPEIMGTDAVYVYIAENYYLTGETTWIDSTNLQGIRTRVHELKPLLLGNYAPPMEGLVNAFEQPVDLQKINSKFLILFFWSPDCGFCKEAAPRLFSQYANLKQTGIEIVALNTRLDKDLWIKFITDNQLDWINVYAPQNSRDMVDKYQAFTTPILYILDSERRIIAKNISVDQVKPFFEQYLSRH